MNDRVHCIILFAASGKSDPLRRQKKAYALLPEAFTNRHPDAVRRLQDTGILVVRNGDNPPVFAEDVRLEMFEFILRSSAVMLSADSYAGVNHPLFRFFRIVHFQIGIINYDTSHVPLAFDNGNSEIFKRLWGHRFPLGRSLFSETGEDEECNILRYAVKNELKILIGLLLARCTDVRFNLPGGTTSLHVAAAFGSSAIVEQIYATKANLEARDNRRRTALHYATVNGFSIVVQQLLDRGARVDVYDCSYNTPLHLAASRGFSEIVQMLLLSNAAVTVYGNNNTTPLHIAAGRGFSKIVEMLLTRVANVDIFDGNHSTPLHLAAGKCFPEIVQQLLSRGASVDVCDITGSTPLHLAVGRGSSEIIQQLPSKGASLKVFTDSSPPHRATVKDVSEIVRLLVERGVPIGVKDSNGNTPLHLAAIKGPPVVVQSLIAMGAPVNATNNEGLTPLHCTKDGAVAKILLENNASIKARSTNGSTPLHTALSGDKVSVLMIRLLIQEGADVHSTDIYGSTPLLHAVKQDLPVLVKVLVKYGANVKFDTQSVLGMAVPCASKIRDPSVSTFACLLESCFVDPSLLRAHLPECTTNHGWGSFNGVLARHIVKIRSLNIEHHNFHSLDPEPFVKDDIVAVKEFERLCESEVVRTKREKFCGSDVTIYDILTRNDQEVARVLKNNAVADAADRKDWKNMYPMYGNILMSQIDKGKLRNSMQAEGMQLCDFTFGFVRRIPEEIVIMILSYLNVEDIFTLRYACSPSTQRRR